MLHWTDVPVMDWIWSRVGNFVHSEKGEKGFKSIERSFGFFLSILSLNFKNQNKKKRKEKWGALGFSPNPLLSKIA